MRLFTMGRTAVPALQRAPSYLYRPKETKLKSLVGDKNRMKEPETGIYVRALLPNTAMWKAIDIAHLTADSLLRWLRQSGGDNPIAENTVGILLGHGHLHNPENKEKTDAETTTNDQQDHKGP